MCERFLLDFRDHFSARGKGGTGIGARGDRRVNAGCYVFDGFQNVQFEIEAFDFVGLRLGVEAGLEIIFFRCAEFLQRVRPDVMVGNEQGHRR